MSFKFELTGLDAVRKRLGNVQDGVTALSGDIPLNFNPHDDDAVAEAIRHVESVIDERAEPYRDDPVVMKAAADMKRLYEQRIHDRVQQERESSERP